MFGTPFPILVIDEERVTPRHSSSGNISPPISHHETARDVYVPLTSRLDQHSRFWLAAIATVRIYVITRLDVIAYSRRAQLSVHLFHHFPALDTRGDIGLIRDDDDQAAGVAQCPGGALDSRENLERIKGRWRIWLSVTHQGAIDDAIAIEEYCPLHVIGVAGFSGRRLPLCRDLLQIRV